VGGAAGHRRPGGAGRPAPRWYCGDTSRFGTKAIFIDHVDAPSLQTAFVGGLDPASQVEAVVDLMAAVAAVEPEQLPPRAVPAGRLGQLPQRGRRRVAAGEAELVESSPITRWIAAGSTPTVPRPALRLVHGDFQASNVLHAPGGYQLVDWEYARIGDPREDLGYYNAYSLAAPTNLYALDPEAFLSRYGSAPASARRR
jgi:aminoglycoside phosphotransferase (APT) family kinase protein